MDFNKQRKAVSAINGFAKRHPFWKPACVVVRVLVILFCSAVRAADMALSDKDGNFLGIRRKPAVKSGRRAAVRQRAKRAELRHRPLWQRTVSLALAFGFGSMAVPSGIELGVFAAEKPELILESDGTLRGFYLGDEKYFCESDEYPIDISDEEMLYAVSAIEDEAFRCDEALSSVDLTSHGTALENVGAEAFAYACSLSEIHLVADENTYFDEDCFKGLAPDTSIFLVSPTGEYTDEQWAAITKNLSDAHDYEDFGYNDENHVYKLSDNITVYDDSESFYSEFIPSDACNVTVTCDDDKVSFVLGNPQDMDDADGINIYTQTTENIEGRKIGKYVYAGSIPFSGDDKSIPLSIDREELEDKVINAEKNTLYISTYAELPAEFGNTYSVSGSKFVKTAPVEDLAAPAASSATPPAKPINVSTATDQIVEDDSVAFKWTFDNTSGTGRDDANGYIIKITKIYDRDNDGADDDTVNEPDDILDSDDLKNNTASDYFYIEKSNGFYVYRYKLKDDYPCKVKFNVTGFEFIDKTLTGEAKYEDSNLLKSNVSDSAVFNINRVTGLKADTSTAESIKLTWDKFPKKVVKYEIKTYEMTSNGKVLVDARQTDNTYCTFVKNSVITDPVTGVTSLLKADTEYYFTVKPIENSRPTDEYPSQFHFFCPGVTSKIVTNKIAPSAPYNVKVTPGDKKLDIEWQMTPGAVFDGFYIAIEYDAPDGSRQTLYQNSFDNGSSAIKNNSGIYSFDTSTSVKGISLINGTNYYVYVYSYVRDSNGAIIKSSSYGLNDYNQLPSAKPVSANTTTIQEPSNFKVVAGNRQNTLTWNAVSGADGYIIKWHDSNGNSGEFRPLDASTVEYVDDNRVNDVTYYYEIRSYVLVNGEKVTSTECAVGQGTPKATNSTVLDPTVVLVPSDFTLTTDGKNITLSWTKVEGASGYRVSRVVAGKYESVGNVTDTTVTYRDLQNGTYTYVVQAYKTFADGDPIYSDYSVERTGVIGVYLAAPTDFTAVAGDGQATLSWTAVKDAYGYEVCIIDQYGNPVRLDLVSKTTAIHTGLTNGTVNTYSVRAYKLVNGDYFYSDYAPFKTITIGNYLAAPSDLIATAGDRQIALSWSAVPGASGYVVYSFNAASGSFEPVGVVTATTFTHTNLINGSNYTYMVAAFSNTNGSDQYGPYSIAVSAVPMGNDSNNTSGTNPTPTPDNKGYTIYVVGTTPYGLNHGELITAYADEGALTSDVDLRFSMNTESTDMIYDTLDGYAEGLDSFHVYPFDIAMYASGTTTPVQPVQGHYVTITMPMPEGFTGYGEDVQLMHINSVGKMEIIPLSFGVTDGVMVAQFRASEFSPYAFVHYYTPEDMHSGAAADAGMTPVSGSGYSLRFSSTVDIYPDRRRNKIFKVVKKN